MSPKGDEPSTAARRARVKPDRRRKSSQPNDLLLRVPISHLQHYELVALLLTLMAFPKLAPDQQPFENKRRAMCAALLLRLARSKTAYVDEFWKIKLIYLAPTQKEADGAWRAVCTAMSKRHAAGRVALSRLGLRANCPEHGLEFTQIELMKEALGENSIVDAKIAMQRHWRNILHILLICIAFEVTAIFEDSKRSDPYGLLDLLVDPNALHYLLKQIAKFQTLVAGKPEEFQPPSLPRVELVLRQSPGLVEPLTE